MIQLVAGVEAQLKYKLSWTYHIHVCWIYVLKKHLPCARKIVDILYLFSQMGIFLKLKIQFDMIILFYH